jgi:ornithine decarboxylase
VHADEGAELLRAIAAAGAKAALTFHVGSLCTDPQAYVRALTICAETAAKARVPLHAIDAGGGFPAVYPGVPQPPLSAYFGAIADARQALGFDPNTAFLCEPGRALCADGVTVVTQVSFRRGDSVFLNDGIYGSLNEFTLPNWPARYPLSVYSAGADGRIGVKDGARKPIRAFGPTCDTLDKLPVPLSLPGDVAAGDWIAFGQMGAYSTSLRTAFNGFYPDTFATVAEG